MKLDSYITLLLRGCATYNSHAVNHVIRFPGLLSLLLHTASDQKLEVRRPGNEDMITWISKNESQIFIMVALNDLLVLEGSVSMWL